MMRFGSTLAAVFMILPVSGDARAGDPCVGQPDGFPCDAGDACTADDQCAAEICTGTYQSELYGDLAAPFGIVDIHDMDCVMHAFGTGDCPGADIVGNNLSCKPNGFVDFDDISAVGWTMSGTKGFFCPDPCPLLIDPCKVDADCADGLFCSGAETCVDGECLPGFDPCPGNACDEGTTSCFPIGALMSCQMSSPVVSPNGSVTLRAFLQNATDVSAYQTRVVITLTSGQGILSVQCTGYTGDSIEFERPDWIFNSAFLGAVCDSLIGGAVTLLSDADVGPTPAYLSTYTLDASADVTPGSTFEISFLPGPHSFILDNSSNEQPLALGPPCVVTVVADCALCTYGDITTTAAGDCVPQCTGQASDVNFDDVLCALNGFARTAECPCADIAGAVETPCVPNGIIDFDDILAILNAFAGASTCPDPCI